MIQVELWHFKRGDREHTTLFLSKNNDIRKKLEEGNILIWRKYFESWEEALAEKKKYYRQLEKKSKDFSDEIMN
jgi:hypothetical protein